MAYRDSYEDDEAELDEREDPDPADMDGDDDEEPAVPCPFCKREIHEDAEICPYCRNWVRGEDAPPGRKPAWLVAGVVVCLVLVVLTWVLTHG
jgi:hypothetical protein